jgi:hypothetical protein
MNMTLEEYLILMRQKAMDREATEFFFKNRRKERQENYKKNT